MAVKKFESEASPKPQATKPPPAKKPPEWWDGLSDSTASELRRLGYECRNDVLLFLAKPRYINASLRGQMMVYDPLSFARSWLNDGFPRKIPVEMFNEVRAWLGNSTK